MDLLWFFTYYCRCLSSTALASFYVTAINVQGRLWLLKDTQMRERMWYYHLESIANFQYFGMEWDICSVNICHLYTCPTFKGVLSALLFHCIVQVLLSKEVHNHSFPNLPWFVLLETLLRFNKLAKLRSCVNRIHFRKYTWENTIWKIQFGKYI